MIGVIELKDLDLVCLDTWTDTWSTLVELIAQRTLFMSWASLWCCTTISSRLIAQVLILSADFWYCCIFEKTLALKLMWISFEVWSKLSWCSKIGFNYNIRFAKIKGSLNLNQKISNSPLDTKKQIRQMGPRAPE